MNTEQALALGALLRATRKQQGLPLTELAESVGVNESWIKRLEAGRYTDPNPTLVARLAETLDVDAAAVDAVSGGLLARSLPSMRTYFRSREGLSTDAVAEVEAAVAEIRARYSKPARDTRSDFFPEVPEGHEGLQP